MCGKEMPLQLGHTSLEGDNNKGQSDIAGEEQEGDVGSQRDCWYLVYILIASV